MNRALIILFIFFVILPVYTWAQKDSLESAIELEAQARQLQKEWKSASIEKSIKLYNQAESAWRKKGEISRAVACVREIARMEWIRGNSDRARRIILQVLQRPDSKPHLAERAKSTSLLALLELGSDETDLTRKLVDEALKLAELSGDLGAKAAVSFSAAGYAESRRNIPDTISHYRDAIKKWDISGDKSQKAFALLELSYILASVGEPFQGLDQIAVALAHFKQEDNSRGIVFSYIANGHLLSVIGEKQKALEFYKKATDLFPENLDLYDQASMLNGIGYIYEEFSEWELSLNYRKKAVTLFEKRKHFYGKLATLPSLIKLSFKTGDLPAAFEYLAQTESLSRKIGDTFWIAIALKQVGDYSFDIGSDAKALDYYSRSLKVLEKAGLKIEVALIYDKIGLIYERQLDYDRARTYYDSSLKISREISHKVSEANSLFNLARLNSAEAKDQEALNLSLKSISATEAIFADIRNSRFRTTYVSSVFERYDLLIQLLMTADKKAPSKALIEQAFQVSEKSKARALIENLRLAEADLKADADPATLQKEKEISILLNSQSDELSRMLSQNADQSEIDKLNTEIIETHKKLEDIISELKQESPIYSAIKDPKPFDVADFQLNVLDEDSVLLEFSLGVHESYLWVIGKTHFDSFRLPPRSQIEARIDNLRSSLNIRELTSDESIEDFQNRIAKSNIDYWSEAHNLSNELLGPANEMIKGKRLIVVADGKLHYLPISSLPQPNSESDDPILLESEIVYVPSASALEVIANKTDRLKNSKKGILIFADPVYSRDDERMVGKDFNIARMVSTFFSSLRSIGNLDSLSGVMKKKLNQ